MILGLTYYEICIDFLVYSFMGWVLEVVFHAAKLGKIVNRGFLNGPVCPVYGFGMVGLLMLLQSISSTDAVEDTNVFALFFICMFFGSAVELLAGWLLDVIFHMRWWDYSDQPFNIHGYICLRFSLLWGVGGVVVIGMLYPMLSNITTAKIPQKYGWIVMLLLYIVYFVDFIVTVATIMGLNRKLKEIDRMQKLLHKVSDNMTEYIGTTAYKAGEQIGEGAVQASLAKEEILDKARTAKAEATMRKIDMETNIIEGRKNLQEKYAAYSEKISNLQQQLRMQSKQKTSGVHRILRAFPDLKSEISSDAISKLRSEMEKKDESTSNTVQTEQK